MLCLVDYNYLCNHNHLKYTNIEHFYIRQSFKKIVMKNYMYFDQLQFAHTHYCNCNKENFKIFKTLTIKNQRAAH